MTTSVVRECGFDDLLSGSRDSSSRLRAPLRAEQRGHQTATIIPALVWSGVSLWRSLMRLDLVSGTASGSGILELQYRRHR